MWKMGLQPVFPSQKEPYKQPSTQENTSMRALVPGQRPQHQGGWGAENANEKTCIEEAGPWVTSAWVQPRERREVNIRLGHRCRLGSPC